MSDTFNTFPKSKISALAMLYVEQHASSEHTPEELLDMYEEAYKRIHKHNQSGKNSQVLYV